MGCAVQAFGPEMKATGKALKDAKVRPKTDGMFLCLKLHPPKTNMIIKQEPFEDVSLM